MALDNHQVTCWHQLGYHMAPDISQVTPEQQLDSRMVTDGNNAVGLDFTHHKQGVTARWISKTGWK